MTHIDCFICDGESIKKVTTRENQGDFFLCGKDACKEVLEYKLLNIGEKYFNGKKLLR